MRSERFILGLACRAVKEHTDVNSSKEGNGVEQTVLQIKQAAVRPFAFKPLPPPTDPTRATTKQLKQDRNNSKN